MKKNNQTPTWFRYPEFNWDKKHALVIGGGIAGCQTAWHLVQQGWQVTLIERDAKIAQHASGNPAGIISPKMTVQKSLGEDFYTTCFAYAVKQLSTLKDKHESLEWHDCGLLQLAHNDREELRWQSLMNRCLTKEFDDDFLQCVDKEQSSGIAGIPIDYKASYFPQAGWINPVSFCEILLKDCADDCEVILETDVIKLEKHQNNWTLLNQKNQEIASSEIVIITSGKDLNQFPQTNTLPSMPVAGQTTSADSNAFSDQLKTTIGHEGYLTPMSDKTSQLTFGASFDRNIDNPLLDSKTDNNNLAQLHKYLPQLTDSFEKVNSAHVAVRMTTPDRFPYIGGIANADFYTKNYSDLHQGKHYKAYPNAEYIDGLFVLAGLGSRGLTTSGLLAKTLSDILNNQSYSDNNIDGDSDTKYEMLSIQEDCSIQQYCHPARFIIKDFKRNMKTKTQTKND